MTDAVGPGTRLKCIDASHWLGLGPAEGEIVTVTEVIRAGSSGFDQRSMRFVKIPQDFYRLAGYDKIEAYASSCFRPLDGIDELTELFREKVKDPDPKPVKAPEKEREYVVVR